MKNTEKKQFVETIYAKNMDRTDKGINDLVITEALAEAMMPCNDSNEYFMVLSARKWVSVLVFLFFIFL